MPPSMRNPQKSSPSASPASRMIDSVNALVTQGMIRLSGPSQLLRRQAAQPPHVGGVDGARICSKISSASSAGLPLVAAAEQILGGDHVEDRADVLRHPAVDQDQALGERLGEASRYDRRLLGDRWPGSVGCSGGVWAGSRRPRLTPHSGSPSGAATPWISLMPGKIPPESCQPPPDPPSHSPRIARATTTLASSGSSGPVRLRVWPVARINKRDQRSQQVGRDGQPRTLGNVVDLADDLQPVPGPDDPASRSASRVCVPSRAGGISPEATTAALTSPR